MKFDAEGKLRLALGTKGEPGEAPTSFDRPDRRRLRARPASSTWPTATATPAS